MVSTNNTCLELIEDQQLKIVYREWQNEDYLLQVISKHVTDWRMLAKYLSLPEASLEFVDRVMQSDFEKCYFCLEHRFLMSDEEKDFFLSNWKTIIRNSEISTHQINEIEEEMENYEQYFNERPNLLLEIAKRITSWEDLAKALELKRYEINTIRTENEATSARNLQAMLYGLRKLHLPIRTGWDFWREKLDKFETGRKAIADIDKSIIIPEMELCETYNTTQTAKSTSKSKDSVKLYGERRKKELREGRKDIDGILS